MVRVRAARHSQGPARIHGQRSLVQNGPVFSSGQPIALAARQCRDLPFAPFPVILSTVGRGWRSLTELELDPQARPYGFTLAAVLRAEHDHSVPGPHAVHALRTLTRELIFATAASLYLTGRASVFDDRDWLIRGVGRSAGSVEPAVLVGDRTGDDDASAAMLVSLITPLVTAIRHATRVGPRTLWSYVVDTACFAMINIARQLDRDRSAAWNRAERLAEALYAAGVPRYSHPELARYDGTNQSGIWAIRGACCLDFKDPEHGYCVTCPLLDGAERAARWRAVRLPTVQLPSAG